MRKFVYVSEMLIVRHLGTPNSGFNGCHCMRDPVLYRSMGETGRAFETRNQRSQRDDSRIQKERNKANDFTFKLQYDVSIFSNRRQSDFTKCSLMISQREIMISQLV